MAFYYAFGTDVNQVFDYLRIKKEKREWIIKQLQSEGYTKQSICYAAARAEEKLYRFISDDRMPTILMNEVRKYAFKRDDPRWNRIKKSKE